MPTIIEPLRADWELVQGQVKELRDQKNQMGALATVKTSTADYARRACWTQPVAPATSSMSASN